jgi:hypothetical protein
VTEFSDRIQRQNSATHFNDTSQRRISATNFSDEFQRQNSERHISTTHFNDRISATEFRATHLNDTFQRQNFNDEFHGNRFGNRFGNPASDRFHNDKFQRQTWRQNSGRQNPEQQIPNDKSLPRDKGLMSGFRRDQPGNVIRHLRSTTITRPSCATRAFTRSLRLPVVVGRKVGVLRVGGIGTASAREFADNSLCLHVGVVSVLDIGIRRT